MDSGKSHVEPYRTKSFSRESNVSSSLSLSRSLPLLINNDADSESVSEAGDIGDRSLRRRHSSGRSNRLSAEDLNEQGTDDTSREEQDVLHDLRDLNTTSVIKPLHVDITSSPLPTKSLLSPEANNPGKEEERVIPKSLEYISCLIHLAVFDILGATTRYLLHKLFGPTGARVTSDGSILYLDLPSNMVGSFLMGWFGVISKADIARVSEFLAIGLSTDYLGSLTTFSGWNQKMLDLSVDGQWVYAVLGFLLGFFSMTERRSIHENLQKWVMCPICRQHTDVRNIAYADDRQNGSSSDQDHKENEASLAVQGSYGTKIEAVTRRILWIKSSDPQSKVLVFSSWNDVLDVLEHALAANGIAFIRMKGGRKSQTAISKFKGGEKENQKTNSHKKEAKSIQVLLLLVQHGANGLNLLEAQHVILVEPLLNPAAEAQAVGRVHRIGQEKPTLVHRFLVTSTVEESINKLNRSKNTIVSSFSSRKTKNQDQQFLTLRDLESLFASPAAEAEETEENLGDRHKNLRDLPPSLAAAIAAERRMKEINASSSTTNTS